MFLARLHGVRHRRMSVPKFCSFQEKDFLDGTGERLQNGGLGHDGKRYRRMCLSTSIFVHTELSSHCMNLSSPSRPTINDLLSFLARGSCSGIGLSEKIDHLIKPNFANICFDDWYQFFDRFSIAFDLSHTRSVRFPSCCAFEWILARNCSTTRHPATEQTISARPVLTANSPNLDQ